MSKDNESDKVTWSKKNFTWSFFKDIEVSKDNENDKITWLKIDFT